MTAVTPYSAVDFGTAPLGADGDTVRAAGQEFDGFLFAISASFSLDDTGAATSNDDFTAVGTLKTTDTTNSTSTTTGALQSAGGLGVAKAINVGGLGTFGDDITVIGDGRFGSTGLTSALIQLTSTVNSRVNFGDAAAASPGFVFYDHATNAMQFGTDGSESATLDSAGNLSVNGTGTFGDDIIQGVEASGNDFTVIRVNNSSFGRTGTTNASILSFSNANGVVGSISVAGTATAYNTASDPRKKSEFRLITGALDMINEAVENSYIGEFDWLSDGTITWGYNAHALIDNQPGFGGTDGEGPRDEDIGHVYDTIDHPEELDEEDEVVKEAWTEDMKVTAAGVDQSKRVPILEMAIYELMKRVEELETAK